MNTNQLLTFLTLLQTESYQKTALELNYARSTVMDHINALEWELGTVLFEKKGRGILPTPAGRHFSIHAKTIIDTYHQALTEAQNPTLSSHLRIISVETLGLYFLRDSFSNMLSRHPDMEHTIKFGAQNFFCEQLRRGEADIAFGFAGQSWGRLSELDFTITPICREPIIFFSNPGCPLAQLPSVGLRELKNYPFLLVNKDGIYYESLQRLAKRTGIQIKPKQYVDSGTLLKELVMSNNYASIVSRCVIASELREGKLVELPWNGDPLYGEIIAVTRNEPGSQCLEEFISIVKNSYAARHY